MFSLLVLSLYFRLCLEFCEFRALTLYFFVLYNLSYYFDSLRFKSTFSVLKVILFNLMAFFDIREYSCVYLASTPYFDYPD